MDAIRVQGVYNIDNVWVDLPVKRVDYDNLSTIR